MFTFDEKRFFAPKPCDPTCPPPEKPHSFPEKVEMTSRMLRDTLDRLLMFEKTMTDKYNDLMAIMTQDNVVFKELMQDAYSEFVSAVRSEINLFETNTDSVVLLFKEAINTRLEEFNKNYSEAFAAYQQEITTYLNTFEDDIREQFDLYKTDVNRIVTEYGERLNAQDVKIADAVSYMKTNLNATLENLFYELEENGGLTGVIDSEIVRSVKQFGAVGDGVTDDTAAIQTAINECCNLFFPAGTYIISDTLVIPAVPMNGDEKRKTVINGAFEQTFIKFNGTGNAIVNNGDLYISNVWVEGTGNNLNGLFNTGNVKMYHCQFNNNGKNGLMFDEAVHSVHNIIDNCTFYANKENGIHCVTNVYYQCTAIRIINSYCVNNGSETVNANAQTNGNGNGILLGACLGVSVLNTVCEYNHGAGILIRNEGEYGVFNVCVIGGYFEGNRLANIYLNNANDNLAYREIFIKGNYYSYYPATLGTFYNNSLLGTSIKTVIKNPKTITESFIDNEIFDNTYMRKYRETVYLEHGTVEPMSFKSLTATVTNLDVDKGLHVTPLGAMKYGTIVQASYTGNPNEIRIDVFNITNSALNVTMRGYVVENTY